MELPPFPAEFSGQARKNVIHAEVRAGRAIREATRSKPELTHFYVYGRSANLQVLKLYVLPIFLAFAQEACRMATLQNAPWLVDRIDGTVREFLRKIAIESQRQFDSDDYPVQRMTGDFGYLSRQVIDAIEDSVEWKQYQDALLEIQHPPELVKQPLPIALDGPSQQTIGARLDAIVFRKGISHEELAHRIGISRTTYFEVKAGRGGRKARVKTEYYLDSIVPMRSATKTD